MQHSQYPESGHCSHKESHNPELLANRLRAVRIDFLSNTVPNIRHLVRGLAIRRRTAQISEGRGTWGHILRNGFGSDMFRSDAGGELQRATAFLTIMPPLTNERAQMTMAKPTAARRYLRFLNSNLLSLDRRDILGLGLGLERAG